MGHRPVMLLLLLLLPLLVACPPVVVPPGDVGAEGEGEGAGEGEGEGEGEPCADEVCDERETCVADVGCRTRCDAVDGCRNLNHFCCDGFCATALRECSACSIPNNTCPDDETCAPRSIAGFDSGTGVCLAQVDEDVAIADFGDCQSAQSGQRNVCERGSECFDGMCTPFCRSFDDCADGDICVALPFTNPVYGRCLPGCSLDDNVCDSGRATLCTVVAEDCLAGCIQPGFGEAGDPCSATELECSENTRCLSGVCRALCDPGCDDGFRCETSVCGQAVCIPD